MDKNMTNYPLDVPAPHHFTFAVRDLPTVTVEQRERALKATHYNEFAFPSSWATRPMAATPATMSCWIPSATFSSGAGRRTGRSPSTWCALTAGTWRR